MSVLLSSALYDPFVLTDVRATANVVIRIQRVILRVYQQRGGQTLRRVSDQILSTEPHIRRGRVHCRCDPRLPRVIRVHVRGGLRHGEQHLLRHELRLHVAFLLLHLLRLNAPVQELLARFVVQ